MLIGSADRAKISTVFSHISSNAGRYGGMHVDCEVVLELPLMEKVAPPDADFPRNTGLTKPITVLVVEDDEEAAFMAQIWLTQAGDGQFRMEWSASLRQAMARLGRPGIDVVLLDLGMPEL